MNDLNALEHTPCMIDQYVLLFFLRVFGTIGIEVLVIHNMQEFIIDNSKHFGKCTNMRTTIAILDSQTIAVLYIELLAYARF